MIYLKQATNKQFYFTVKHSNGQTLVTSETYTRKSNCVRTATRMVSSCGGIIDQTMIKPRRTKAIKKKK
jgi:uncharacterized protein YegP (UPF0339 family)